MPQDTATTSIISKARKGSVTAIARLASIISSSPGPSAGDVEAVTQGLMHNVCLDLKARNDPDDKEAVSPIMLSSLRSMWQVLGALTALNRQDLFTALQVALENPPENRTMLLDWFCVNVPYLASDPAEHLEAIAIVDRVVIQLLNNIPSEDPCKFNLQITDVQALEPLVHLWLRCLDEDLAIISLPQFVVYDVLPLDKFLSVFGGTKRDLARICLQSINVVQRLLGGGLTAVEQSLMIHFIRYLGLAVPEMLECLVLEGLISTFATLMAEEIYQVVINLDESGAAAHLQGGQSALSDMMSTIADALALGPSCIIQAVDSIVLSLALQASTYKFHLRVQGTEDALELESAIKHCLSTIQQHLYHPRVTRHLSQRNKDTSVSEDILKQVIEKAPLGPDWDLLWKKMTHASDILQRVKDEGPPPSCANKQCRLNQERKRIRWKVCSSCHTLRVCSSACQREIWPEHRQNCLNIAARVNQSILRPPDIISQHEREHYEQVAAHLAMDMGDTYTTMVRENMLKLCPLTPSSGTARHVLWVDTREHPVSLDVVPLSSFRRKVDVSCLERNVQKVQATIRSGFFLVGARFTVGKDKITVFAMEPALPLLLSSPSR